MGAADLRRVHDGPRARVGAGGRGRAGHRGARERADHPQHHLGDAADPRPRRPLLPPARARLGRRHAGAEGRPGQDVAARRIDLVVAEVEPELLQGDPGSREGAGRQQAAQPVHRRLLGPSRVPPAARGEPDGGGALPRGARVAARLHPHPRGAGRQEPEPADLPRRRHDDGDGSERAERAAQPRADRLHGAGREERDDVRRAGVPARRARGGQLLSRVVQPRRGPRQLPELRRLPDGRRARRLAVHDAARHHSGERPVAPAPGRPRSGDGVRHALVVPGTRPATRPGGIPTTARRSRSTPGRRRPTSSSRSIRSTPG